MSEVYFKGVFEYPIKEFLNHLENPYNERIIFSGKYGIGKTRFLQDFFSTENQRTILKKTKYDVYRLSPTNYSIASNEDILRYIKYDIIIEMLKQKAIQLDEVKLKLLDTFPFYLKKNLHKVAAGIVSMIPKLGKEIVDCFDRIDKLKEEYLKIHDELNISPGDRLTEYLEQLEIKEGSIYESDITTTIISEAINKNNETESLLIIDDVDRLDPEHVFRILNVFASHFDANPVSGNKNKFNFDKIILVCDFNNIRNIFHHRHGIEVDFMGYIDKFYSSDVYHFDNKKAIRGVINEIFESIEVIPLEGENVPIIKQLYIKNGFVSDLTSDLISQGLVSLRNILKLYNRKVAYHSEKIYFDNRNSDIPAWNNPIIMQLRIIRDIFGDYQNMKFLLQKFIINEEFLEQNERRFGELIYILSSKAHNFYSRDIFLYTFHEHQMIVEVKRAFANDQFQFVYLFEWTGSYDSKGIPEKGNQIKITTEMLKNALLDSVDFLNKRGYLK